MTVQSQNDLALADLVGREWATAGSDAGAIVTDVRLTIRMTRLAHPIVTANYLAADVFHVVCRMRTADGSVGVGHAFCFARPYAEVLQQMVQALSDAQYAGADVSDPVALWKKAYSSLAFFGHAGISLIALSVLDTAAWDALGHVRNVSVVQMLGGQDHDYPAYGSDRLWLGDGSSELEAGVWDMIDDGLRAVKLRLGSPTTHADVERVETVLKSLPAGVDLLVDANQGWSRQHAVETVRRLSEFELGWLEEPVVAADWEGFAAAKAVAGSTRIAGGESWYGVSESLRALDASHLDVFMPDLQRMGGVTPWLVSAKAALAQGVVVSPHLFPEVSYSLMAGLGIDALMEHVSWNDDLFVERPELHDGAIRPGAGPGLGVRLAPGVMDD